MRPGFAYENRANSTPRNAKLPSNFCWYLALTVTPSNFSDGIRVELGRALTLAIRMALLLVHIFHVVYLRTFEQVLWIVAASTVALVKHTHTFGNRAFVKFVRSPMREALLSIMTKVSIALRSERSLPIPTFIWRTRRAVSPKVFSKGFVFGLTLKMTTDKAHWLPFYAPSFRRRSLSYWRRLTTAAHAKSARVWAFKVTVLLRMMALEIASWLALNTTVFFVGMSSNGRKFSATTLTVAIRDFVRGIIGVHGKLPFLCQAGELQLARHFALVLHE